MKDRGSLAVVKAAVLPSNAASVQVKNMVEKGKNVYQRSERV